MNCQTIPRDDKVVKAAFVPKLDAFIFADYPNIELKILAMYLESLGHPSMADVFRAGADLHRETAAGIYSKSSEAVTDLERQVGKKLNFSIVYGGGMPTIMEQLSITAPQALKLLKAYHATWPGIGWATKRREADHGTLDYTIGKQIAARATATEPGYIVDLYGRHLHPHSPHVRINALCQGCAAGLMKWAMVRVHKGLTGWKSHIVNMVHDELMLDVFSHEAHWVANALPEWMTDPRIDRVVPIRPSCEISWTTWAEKESYG